MWTFNNTKIVFCLLKQFFYSPKLALLTIKAKPECSNFISSTCIFEPLRSICITYCACCVRPLLTDCTHGKRATQAPTHTAKYKTYLVWFILHHPCIQPGNHRTCLLVQIITLQWRCFKHNSYASFCFNLNNAINRNK